MRHIIIGLAVVGLGTGPVVPAAADDIQVATFSDLAPGGVPAGWEPWVFPSIDAQTDYSLHEHDERVVLRARSVASASALVRYVTVDPGRHPHLSWSWKTDAGCFSGHWRDPERDDFPLRLFVLFEPPRGFFSFFNLRRRLSSLDGNALLYVPHAEADDREVRTSHLSDRIRVVPLDPARLARGWTYLTRNVQDDYVTLFGEAPPRIAGIALMTDTDNSVTDCVSYFGDISFTETGE